MDIPMSLAFDHLENKELFFFGTDEGCVQLYDIAATRCREDRNTLSHLRKWNIHKSWVTGLTISKALGSIISCSYDKTIKISNVEYKTPSRTLLGHKKSIVGLDWSKKFKMIASCGMEKDIFLWDPMMSKPLSLLSGHQAPLHTVRFNSRDSQLISLDQDKFIKTWDIRMFRCLQTMKEKRFQNSDEKLTTIVFDSRNDTLIVCGNTPYGYPVRTYEEQNSPQSLLLKMRRKYNQFKHGYKGHELPVISILYNETFNIMVSVDEHHVFSWDILEGELLFKFKVEKGIVSAVLDTSERRVILSHPDGSVTVSMKLCIEFSFKILKSRCGTI